MSGELTAKDVKKIAALARLGLNLEEAKSLAHDVAQVLTNFAQIQAIDTTGTPTADTMTALQNVTREDRANSTLCAPEALLAAAPSVHDGHLKVKAIFE